MQVIMSNEKPIYIKDVSFSKHVILAVMKVQGIAIKILTLYYLCSKGSTPEGYVWIVNNSQSFYLSKPYKTVEEAIDDMYKKEETEIHAFNNNIETYEFILKTLKGVI